MRRPNMQAMEIVYSFNHYTESWIEVSSHPSTSSLSSTSTEDIITTGLQVQHYPNPNRRRRFSRNGYRPRGGSARRGNVVEGCQEEYEESESESDRFLSSSNEGPLHQISPYDSPAPPASSTSEDASSDVEDDENSTALGTTTNHNQSFIPQPNAFSHPPQSRSARYPPPSETRNPNNSNSRAAASRQPGNSSSDQRPRGHTPFNMISPNHQVDHDAVLRASLSTLLSCAAAARGLPKRDQPSPNATRQTNRTDPVTVRMVSESALMGEETSGRRPAARRKSTTSSTKSFSDKGKRKASTSKDRREPRKKRRGSGEEITPTLMTWVVSAGVVVIFTMIGFSAGYALGQEVGRVEPGALSAGDGGVIAGGKEVGRGLRRLRWGSTSTLVPV